ncbi:DUF4259 domain-containing protein [Dactylosporangium sp. NBC_01737]|uniref:DUF4259 domain-containing protein n=1 Tax=Dactylosporangium sp. NBC_01737 TaxID=2975959 RepID=UPI002E11F1CE|nr:DUF4259 domain-containing protein [Dactylosporangium sp. NBC_01737]
MGTWDIGQAPRDAAEETGFLDSREGGRASAAAAVIVSQLPGGVPLTSSYAPDFLIDGDRVKVSADLPALAVRALDRVLAADSEWFELWEEASDPDAAFAVVRGLRAQLQASSGSAEPLLPLLE